MAHPLSPSKPDLQTKGPDFIQRGKVHIVRRQFQEAVKVCRLGLLAHPTYVEGRLVLSMALMALARHDEVLAEMRVALELDPDSPMAHLLKGEALYHKRDFEQAREVLIYAYELDPHNEKIRKLLDEIDDVINYGQEPGPRARTETKVYPAQRAQVPAAFSADPSDVLSFSADPSDVLSAPADSSDVLSFSDSFSEWDHVEDDDEPTETEEMSPAAMASIREAVAQVSPGEAQPTDAYDEIDHGAGVDLVTPLALPTGPQYADDDDEEFTTAPFLPPTHLGHRLKLLEDSEWQEPTVSERHESSVIVQVEDLTAEDSGGVDKVVVDESQVGRLPEQRTEESSSDLTWSAEAAPLAPFQSLSGDGPLLQPLEEAVYEDDDPTLVPGQSAEDVPPPLGALEDDQEEPTVIPGRIRSQPLRSPSSAPVEEEEDDDTMVNADAPPPEALFGEEEEWARQPSPRMAHDPTKAVDIDSERGRRVLQLVPDKTAESDVELFHGEVEAPRHESGTEILSSAEESGVEFLSAAEEYAEADEDEDEEGTRELISADSRSPIPDRGLVQEVSDADIYSEELEEIPAASFRTPSPHPGAPRKGREDRRAAPQGREGVPPLHPGAPRQGREDRHAESSNEARDPFAAAIRASAPLEHHSDESDLSELSVEMLPEDVEMPPLPLDARDSVVFDLSSADYAPMVDEEMPVPLPPPLAVEEHAIAPLVMVDEEDHNATRVAFDPADDRDPVGADEFRSSRPCGAARRSSPPCRGAPESGGGARDEAAEFGAGYLPGVDPLGFAPAGEAQRYLDPPQYDVPYEDPLADPMAPYPVAGPDVHYDMPAPDEDELSMEQVDELGGDPRWEGGAGRTAALDQDDGRAYAYVDEGPRGHDPTGETTPGGPQGVRGKPPAPKISRPNDGMLEQMTGDSGLFLRQADVESKPRIRRPRERHPDRSATSWLTILVGEPGSHRWIYLLLSAFGVLALAVAVGLAVRYYRLGEQIDAKRKQAELRLRAGNPLDFIAAAQGYADILSRRSDDQEARAAHSRITAAIPFEFGDPLPATSLREGEAELESANRTAAEIYTLLYSGSLERAATSILTALKQYPDDPIIAYLAGRISLLEGNAVVAVRYLERAHRLDSKDPLVLCALGQARAAQGKSDAALAAFGKALQLNPDHIASVLGKAQVMVAIRRGLDGSLIDQELNTIVASRRKGLASRGQRGWAYLLLARLYFNRGQLGQARQHISQAKSNVPSRDATFRDELAGVLIDSFQLGEAEKAIRQSKKLMPGRPHPFHHMARIELLHSRPQAALAELNHAKGLQYAASNLLRAKIHLELNQLNQASAEVERALGMAEDLLEAHVVQAKVLAAKKQGTAAEAKLKELMRKHPDNAALLTAYGEILLNIGRVSEARDKFQQAIRHDRHSFDARTKLAEVFMSEGKYDDARSSLAEAVRANPGNVMVLMKQAELELNMGDLAEAATNFNEAHRRAPNDPIIHLALAKVLTLQRKFSLAEKAIKSADVHGAAADMLSRARGRLDLMRNRAGSAVSSLLAATRDRESDPESWELLVAAHLMNNDSATARQAVAEMTRRFPDGLETATSAARVELNEGQSGQAVRRLRQRVSQLNRLQPPRQRAELRVLLGRAYQDNGKLGEAAAQYDEAVKSCALCPDPYYRKGLVQDERGQVDEAIASLKKALEVDPNYAEVHYDLGQVYERSGNTAAAISHYKKYLDFNPPNDLAQAAREAINNLRGASAD